MPSVINDKFYTVNLCFVDPRKKERFGDPMVAVIEILKDDNRSDRESLSDSQFMFD